MTDCFDLTKNSRNNFISLLFSFSVVMQAKHCHVHKWQLKILEGKAESMEEKKNLVYNNTKFIGPTRNTNSMTAVITSQVQSNLFILI